MPTIIASFGFRHGKPRLELGAICLDVRKILPKNPYHNRALRQLRGDDLAVIAELEATPGMEQAYHALRESLRKHPGAIYLGCTGGHHRSVYIANRLANDLECDVIHLNYTDK